MKNPRIRNQRVTSTRQRKQQHLLEVSVRRDKARQQRNRAVLGFICRTILVAALLGGAVVGGKEALRRFLWENPDYFLTDVRVTTDGALTREQILSAAQIVEGRNIFTIDLGKAREALDQLPQVERVEIQRVLPDRLTISVIERRPIAWVTAKAEDDPITSEKAFLIDARGVVMRTKTMLPEFLHLPIISGVEVENLAAGQKVRTYEMQSALELIRLNADSTRFQARNVDVAKGYCLVVTDQKHAKITFGLDRVDQQLERLNRLLDTIEPTHRELQTVNLLVERNVPVTFSEPAELEATPAGDGGGSAPPAAAKAPSAAVKKATTHDPAEIKSAPAKSRKTPPNSVKKPFRLNG
jgi:cell division protein FtsQ